MRPLVIVRPEPGASESARAAERLGLRTLVLPLFAVEPVQWDVPDSEQFDALLLTSANAVRHAGSGLGRIRDLPAHCVGDATAAAAQAAGFTIASVGEGSVDALLQSLPSDQRLLHLCGVHRRAPRSALQSIVSVPVYCARELAAPEAFKTIGGAVLAVHSPRAAGRVAMAAQKAGLPRETIAVVAISTEAAQAAGDGWEQTAAAAEPSDSALLALAARLCNNR
jgi:uroporphyrinogen-III synthase